MLSFHRDWFAVGVDALLRTEAHVVLSMRVATDQTLFRLVDLRLCWQIHDRHHGHGTCRQHEQDGKPVTAEHLLGHEECMARMRWVWEWTVWMWVQVWILGMWRRSRHDRGTNERGAQVCNDGESVERGTWAQVSANVGWHTVAVGGLAVGGWQSTAGGWRLPAGLAVGDWQLPTCSQLYVPRRVLVEHS